MKPLKELSVNQRGWTLDVLNIVRRISQAGTARCAVRGAERQKFSRTSQRDVPTHDPAKEFTNEEVYAFSRELETLHPDNRHVRDKIRQQLQVLRDAGLLIHTGTGNWRLP